MAATPSLILAAVLVAAGCRADANVLSTHESTSVRDSAGVQIVESHRQQWNEQTQWGVDTVPVLDIGGSPDDTSRQFSGIGGVHRMPSGNIGVLDFASYSLRFFSDDGTPLGRAGRRGSGPGEFSPSYRPHSFTCRGDTIYVPMLGRILAFADPGGFVREFAPAPRVGVFPSVLGCNGERLVAWTQYAPDPRREGAYPMMGMLSSYNLAGEYSDSIGEFPMEDQTWRRGPEGMGYRPTPYGRRLRFAISESSLATGNGDSFQIELRDLAGALRQVLRAPHLQRPLDQKEIHRFRELVLPDPGVSRDLDTMLTARNMPATIPAFSALLFDTVGNLWVREYDFADATAFFDRALSRRIGGSGQRTMRVPTHRWHIFDSRGSLLGPLTLPRNFDLREVGDDWILGVWRAEDDVEHVRMYRLVRP